METPNPNAKNMEAARRLVDLSYDVVGLGTPNSQSEETRDPIGIVVPKIAETPTTSRQQCHLPSPPLHHVHS